ncbi:MAG: excinuclease ABC subunit UvrA, partial [Endomicrobium sp.]|nr:excinuclease ABC subunit UvrA [Endomicrobium sp.]
MNVITIRGARQHNLKNINLDIPKNRLVVITGLSGSGKSSLAFDTIYAEGQRRYVESLSAYARQFLGVMEKPDVDIIEGLSPAISIEQRTPIRNPRSTVGTVTEVYDFLRLLFAKIGVPHCYKCGRIIQSQSAQQIIDEIMKISDGNMIHILSPLVKGRIGTYEELFLRLKKRGYSRVRVDNNIYFLEEKIKLDRYKKHTIDIVVDRVKFDKGMRSRIASSIEVALKESKGMASVVAIKDGKYDNETTYSEKYVCQKCGVSFSAEIEPKLFSFNSPFGACSGCGGLGSKIEIDENLIVPDKSRSLKQCAIVAWSEPITTRNSRWKNSWSGYYWELLVAVTKRNRISLSAPWQELEKKQREVLLYGDNEFEGVIANMQRRYSETESTFVREEIYTKYMSKKNCPICKGQRLKKEALSILINGKSIFDITKMSIEKSLDFFDKVDLSDKCKIISKSILKEISGRLQFLNNVGLGYLSLERESSTLSGGEAQRIHLATQIGSGLTGILYVLDEPSIGLHQRDNHKLIKTLVKLRDLGNTLIVVEHDEEIMRAADIIIDLGPGAGIRGGYVVAQGNSKELVNFRNSLTGQYLNGELKVPIPKKRKQSLDKWLVIKGAQQFNLKNIDVNIPLGLFVCITGVSGSGKSTLVHEIIYKNLTHKLYGSKEKPGKFKSMEGLENIDKIVIVDQSPIGRTPRSNPITYTGAFSKIRDLFAHVPVARVMGYKSGRFSFNVKGGRCENCHGDGTLKIEMQFLSDIYIRCDICDGKRFNKETLNVRYRNKNIAEILDMTVEDSVVFFENIPSLKKILSTLEAIGLGYIKIGQQATTLSGGEAQRVKLATELSKKATGRTMYILDEPTTGLHFKDVDKLLKVLQKLSCAGNTILVIEHNLDIIKTADWLIDLGPEGGDKGG